jgi:hypothetical protein
MNIRHTQRLPSIPSRMPRARQSARPMVRTDSRLLIFQPIVTVTGTGNDPSDQAAQAFDRWFDGLEVDLVRFKVSIYELSNAVLTLESSPTIEAEPHAWRTVRDFTTVPSDGFDVVTAVSSSGVSAYGAQFSRYIRWRITYNSTAAWHACFAIHALVGESFTEWPQQPRIV